MQVKPSITSEAHFIRETHVVYDHAGALWLPAAETLVFSDMHFEKGSSYGRKGVFLPPYDTRRTLKNVAEVMARWQPKMVVSLGDAFHDIDAEGRMDHEDLETLDALTRQCHWVWILGNHDPLPPQKLGGETHQEIVLGGLHFSHMPCESGNWQVAGHMHPVAKVAKEGCSIRRRCFVTDGERLIVPSFGAYTGGLNILDEAYTPYFEDRKKLTVMLLGENAVYQVPTARLRPDGGGAAGVRSL